MTARSHGGDDGDLSPEVLEAVTRTGRRHLGGFLILMGLLCIALPRVIAMPAEDTANAVAPDDRHNIAQIATTNSMVMGVVGLVLGGIILTAKSKPRRFTL